MKINDNINLCVLIPVYNNDIYIGSVIEDVLQYVKEIIVVNDGSTDKTKEIIEKYSVTLVNHEKNMGKGVALITGFNEALKLGYTHALTIDGDAQHLASEIPGFIDIVKENPEALIFGSRLLQNEKKVPFISKVGKSFSNWWVKIQTGYKFRDTQCGQRVYPLKKIENIITHATRYDFELEILVNASWNGVKLIDHPIQVRYNLPHGRVTHYNYFYDNVLMGIMNMKLVFKKIFFIGYKKKRDGK